MTTFSIMTVCSGNICRSPLAEGLLRERLREIGDVDLSSAGIIARDGDQVTDQILQIGGQFDVDLSAHRARYMIEPYVAGADLLFAMARSHRRAIVEMMPRKVSVTFTLREFARLAGQISDEEISAVAGREATTRDKLKAAVALTASRRGQSDPPASPDEDDVVDPYRRDDETYALSVAQLVPAVGAVVHILSLAARS
ncbi:low molecular weight phosphatase family protein [Subtercola sp. Z020]|uniref:arsenate reductase/protein-tyrosine-phosphatase family protein n=1 Tax=Subtercola sp. Z020 TaxID=2080582 RepID=UPI000CE8B329|nr:low molecular weight phosphatase family protein [Subtercola sp. Z020]PPF82225.1 low molecular weight phosphatase family protein [Subtercola sp. Z020]